MFRNIFCFFLVISIYMAGDCFSSSDIIAEGLKPPSKTITDQSTFTMAELKLSLTEKGNTLWGNPHSRHYETFVHLTRSHFTFPKYVLSQEGDSPDQDIYQPLDEPPIVPVHRVINELDQIHHETQRGEGGLIIHRDCCCIVGNLEDAEAFIEREVSILSRKIQLLLVGMEDHEGTHSGSISLSSKGRSGPQSCQIIINGSLTIYGLDTNEHLSKILNRWLQEKEIKTFGRTLGATTKFGSQPH